MLRPRAMGWVDIVLEVGSAACLCEAIAASRVFEPDRSRDAEFDAWKPLPSTVAMTRQLRARIRPYIAWLPAPDSQGVSAYRRMTSSDEWVVGAEAQVTTWIDGIRPHIESLSELDEQRVMLERLIDVLAFLPDDMRMDLWHASDSRLRTFVPVLLSGAARDIARFMEYSVAVPLRMHAMDGSDDTAAAVASGIVPAAETDGLVRTSRQFGLRRIDIPYWLSGSPRTAITALKERRATLLREADAVRKRIASGSDELDMAGVHWLIQRQNWLEGALERANRGDRFVHLGGWIPRQRYPDLVKQLKQSDKPFLVRLDDGESHGESPSVLDNPAWAKRFELFVNGFGTPGANEVDPSMVLAVVTPLMFGYMFGDVGQGLLLMLAGWLLGSRLSWIRLLVPAGFSSVVFGFLYGSVFSMEHVIPALWLHPLNEPLVVLGLPLLLGMLLMLLSIAFGYVEANWRGSRGDWLRREVPVLLCYLAVPAAFLGVTVAAVPVLLALLSLVLLPPSQEQGPMRRLLALPGALLELLEHWLQLMINTLSFTRLGAFALAHAGLGTALMALSELPASNAGGFAILVVGNVFIIALEGLVVSIQTTRLVMFEFFRRFFEGTGRRFQPLTLEGHPGG